MFGRLRAWVTDHRWDVIYDVAPVLVLLMLGLVDAVTGMITEPVGDGPSASALIPGTVACLALLLRRHRPLLTLAIVLIALVVPPLILPTTLTYWDEFMVWVVALYSCARHLQRPLAFVGLGISAVAYALLPFEFPELGDPGGLIFNGALLAAGFAIGVLARSWSGYRERLVRSAAERAVAEERASRRERVRIARELHDVIAHTITVIVMQAGGARLASASDPMIATATLAQIEDLGRASLAELRSLLPLLREDDADTSASPQPTLADVEELCDRMRRLGLPVTLQEDADRHDIPPSLQLAAYRAVQEGLTNVVKHSGMVDTTVRISRRSSPDMLTVDVTNGVAVGAVRTGASTGVLTGTGRGLQGIEERVRLAGGQFSAGLSGHGEFELRVALPLSREPA